MDPEKQPIDSKESHLQPLTRPSRSSNKLRRIGIPLVWISLSLVSLYYKPTFPTLTFEPTRSDWNPSLGGYWRQFAASPRLDPERGNLRVPLSHSHSKQDLFDEFLTVPSAESAREVSKSFTRETHIAGTEGDRLSALRVKSQWERLLGIPETGPEENVFDAGTLQDRQALMGEPHDRRDRRNGRCRGARWRMMNRFYSKLERFIRSTFSSTSHGHHRSHQHDHHRHPHHHPSLSKPRVWISTYYPYLNYPVSQSLTLTTPNETFVASLTESSFPQDPTSSHGVPTFHGFSKNGTATGQLVYASRGRREDFERLEKDGIDVKGKVVIVQYGGSFRGLKVKAAEEAGAVACIIYSDPAADGDITEENGYEPYPLGPARAPSSVQRGSVQYLSIRPGDPLTPSLPAHNPSLPSSPPRLPLNSTSLNIPKIPSLPISFEDAVPLLKSLNGKGLRRVGEVGWKEGGLGGKGVEYWTGPGEGIVKVKNLMEDKVTKIWNTMAIIPGQIEDEIVVIGNHNDAWTFGAGDPNSGTSSMSEMIRGFSHLLSSSSSKKGWKPFRTILLCSWDAEEYGLVGSTEFGEDFTDWLRERVVGYLNLDVSVSGSAFDLAASPSLADLLQETSAMVKDPTAKEEGKRDLGQTKVKTLGSGSDFSVFLQYIGVAAGNLGFSGAPGDPVYHYHSNYDSFYWMEKFGDPTFERHVVVSKILGLTALRLVEDLVLPLNITAYTLELEKYLTKVVQLPSYPGREQLDLTLLGAKLSNLVKVSRSLDAHASKLVQELDSLHLTSSSHHGRRGKHEEKAKEMKRILKGIRDVNRRKKGFESTLLVIPGEDGLVGREWYKSLVVAPGRWLGYGATTLPGLTEALELDGDVKQAIREVARLEKSIDRATKLLSI